jgi:hypothetical protein
MDVSKLFHILGQAEVTAQLKYEDSPKRGAAYRLAPNDKRYF